MAEITVSDLTLTTLDGTGIFDVLMRATKTHLESEYSKNRIRGPEYATVYLGSVDSVMRTSMEFLLQRQRVALEAELMAQQVLVAQAEVQKANAMVQVALAEVDKTRLEVEILRLNKDKIPFEIAHLQAQTTMVGQQTANLAAEALNIPKQGTVLTNQAAHLAQQTTNLVSEELSIDAKTALMTQQTSNAVIEGTVLTAQKCKLDAEYDHIMGQTTKAASETALLAQKKVTEQAQVSDVGVSDNSVIGKQKLLYAAQADGFKRDAEQKAATILVDSWKVRRSTDETGTLANIDNKLTDPDIGRVVTKLLAGVGA